MTWVTVPVLLPLFGAFFCFLAPRLARPTAALVALVMPVAVAFVVVALYGEGPMRVSVGGWGVPLGIDLYADGLTVAMLSLSAVVGGGATLYSMGYFPLQSGHRREPDGIGWWSLWLLLWAALNALFLTADAFNLYVTLELTGLAAVGLVALDAGAVTAAYRYLLVGLLGSLLYLLGFGLLYGLHGTADFAELAVNLTAGPASWTAVALMTGGLLLKVALFPLHFWLPPAHASAPAPVSAVLSALVVKAVFYALLRLWFGPFEHVVSPLAGQLLALLGGCAVVWGSLQALFASRLKLIIAYSTVAQIGYLFLLFAFLGMADAGSVAWYGGIWLALSHGLAKAGFFMAAGNILHLYGHDRVAELAGAGQQLPVTLLAIGLAGASLIGLPPSGGFIGKWLLLNAAFSSGHWWWAVLLLLGSVLAAAYMFRVLLHAFENREAPHSGHPPEPIMEWTALGLGMGAIVLGLWSAEPFEMLSIGAAQGGLTLAESP